jgi:hypothetical protein
MHSSNAWPLCEKLILRAKPNVNLSTSQCDQGLSTHLFKTETLRNTPANCIVCAALMAVSFAFSASVSAETLFKIVTVRDEIVVGLNDTELKDLGGDAGGIANAIGAKGSLTLWQYAVTQKEGERMVAPLRKIGVLANASLRVEPYKQPFKVLPHE